MTEQYIRRVNGNTYYFSDREMTIYHREDGPAIICSDGYEAWYINDTRHNPDGPAITRAGGSKAWYIDGGELTETEFNALTNQPTKQTMSDTPETDAVAGIEGNWDTKALRMGDFARNLERERDAYKDALRQIYNTANYGETGEWLDVEDLNTDSYDPVVPLRCRFERVGGRMYPVVDDLAIGETGE